MLWKWMAGSTRDAIIFFAEEWRHVIRHGHGAGVMLWLLPALQS